MDLEFLDEALIALQGNILKFLIILDFSSSSIDPSLTCISSNTCAAAYVDIELVVFH